MHGGMHPRHPSVPIGRIARLAWIALALIAPRPASGQAGFEADRLVPCLVEPGLVGTCAAEVPAEGLALASGLDFTHHLLADPGTGAGPDRWLVEDRLTMRAALGWTIGRTLLLSAGLDGAATQRGVGTDGLGAPIERASALGRSWLGAQWIPSPADWPLAVGIRLQLVLPTANPQGLTGPDRTQWRVTALASADLGWLRPVVNLGLTTGEHSRYRNLTRDEGLLYGLGLEAAGPDWPLAGLVEVCGATRLRSAFERRVDQTAEVLTGLRFGRHAGLDVLVAAGIGLVGPSAPRARGIVLLRYTPTGQKRRLEIE